METAVIDLAERGVRSSVVRIANIMHGTTDAGFLPMLIALAKEKGFAGYPGDGANLWNAVHVRDAASLFRLALEKGPAGRFWHAVEDGGIPFREIAEAIGRRLGPPAVSIPADELMVPGYFGFLANIVTQSYPASSLITRRTLGWEPAQPVTSRAFHSGSQPFPWTAGIMRSWRGSTPVFWQPHCCGPVRRAQRSSRAAWFS